AAGRRGPHDSGNRGRARRLAGVHSSDPQVAPPARRSGAALAAGRRELTEAKTDGLCFDAAESRHPDVRRSAPLVVNPRFALHRCRRRVGVRCKPATLRTIAVNRSEITVKTTVMAISASVTVPDSPLAVASSSGVV